MRINGANVLNSNNYTKISIMDNINIHGNYYKNAIKVSEPLTKSLKGKSDQFKIEEIIRYFLRSHKIAMIYEGPQEVVIKSIDDIELRISRKHALSKELIKEIKEKFYIDRMDAYANSDVDFYWVAENIGFGYKKVDYSVGIIDEFHRMLQGLPTALSNNKCIAFGFYNHLSDYDKQFLNRILSDMEEIRYYASTRDCFSSVYKMKKDGKEVYLVVGKELWPFIYDTDKKVESLKEEKAKCKRLQYRMEEFK